MVSLDRALALALALTIGACGSLPPQFVAMPSARAAEPERVLERRRSFHDAQATRLAREWRVLIAPGTTPIAHGESREWYPSGAPLSRREFDHGEPTGTWTTWWENGNKRSECVLGRDAAVAPMQWWFEDGRPSSSGPARDGVREGRWTTWHQNGAKQSEGDYTDNRREGEWIFWNDDGSLRERAVYRNGIRRPLEGAGTP